MSNNRKSNNRRTVTFGGYVTRSGGEGDSRVIRGRAIVFGQPTVLYEDDQVVIRETISPQAVTQEVVDRSDILLTMYHNPEIILGRSKKGKGSLKITLSEDGLDFEASMPETSDGDTALALIRGGQIDGCSFIATVNEEEYVKSRTLSKDDKGRKVADYVIKKVGVLKDLTVCPNPAFPQTYVDALVRSLNDDNSIITNNSDNMDEENVTEVTGQETDTEVTRSAGGATSTDQHAQSDAETIAEVRREVSDLSRRVGAMERRPAGGSRDTMSVTRAIREIVNSGRMGEVHLRREGDGQTPTTTPPPVNNSTLASTGGIVPLTVGEVVKPLREGVIYNLIGVKLPTGLRGDYYWPVVGSSLEAEVAGESVELTPQAISLSKISATRQRLGVTVMLTREAVFQSDGLLEEIIREQMPLAIADALNAVILGTTAKGSLKGPFAEAGVTSKTLANAYGSSTYKELNEIKATLLAKGYSIQGLVWTMSEGTKATLEACPIDSGSGRMVCENDRICGIPVFTSHVMGTKIGLGDWRYQVCGQFDTPSFIVDPYTGARKNEVYLTLNVNAATACLRKDAFVLISPKAS